MELAKSPEEVPIVCSGCLRLVSETLVHVIPYFNKEVRGFVTTYRCEQCWLPSLAETRTRLANTADEMELASAVAFFERRGVILHEFKRGDPAPVIRKMLSRMLDLLKSGTIRLSVGALKPAVELEDATFDMEQNEKLAEAAYDAMYEASQSMAKDCFDDARGYLSKAIDAAKRAGLEVDVARLTARRGHLISVYNTQFRGIR